MTTTHRRSRHAAASRGGVPRTVGVVALIACGSVALALAAIYAFGGRWFVVQTPSMGTAAPVGALVITLPVSGGGPQVGDVISFRPPTEPTSVFTHRVVAVGPLGFTTRGDLNGATDPWIVPPRNVIGRAVALLPNVGWLLRGIPMILLGSSVVWVCTVFVRSPAWRSALRILGVSLSVSLTLFLLRPLVSIVLVATQTVAHGARATVVSTGALPVRISGAGGTPIRLNSGELGRLVLPPATDGHYLISTTLDLPFVGWVAVALICLVPLLWTLVVGLPRDAEAPVPG